MTSVHAENLRREMTEVAKVIIAEKRECRVNMWLMLLVAVAYVFVVSTLQYMYPVYSEVLHPGNPYLWVAAGVPVLFLEIYLYARIEGHLNVMDTLTGEYRRLQDQLSV